MSSRMTDDDMEQDTPSSRTAPSRAQRAVAEATSGGNSLPEAEIAEILRIYGECASLRETARRTGRNPKTVTRYVRRAGMPVGPAHGRGGRADGRVDFAQPHVSTGERDWMIAMARSGHSRAVIAQSLGRSEGTVRRHLARAGVVSADPADQARKHPLNQDAFAYPSPARDYWAGFLAADGNVHESRITLVQNERNEDHLMAYLGFLGSPDRPLHRRPSTCSAAAVTFSKRMATDLATLGITPQKSLTLELSPELADSAACWLGLLDGDGSTKGKRADRQASPYIKWIGTRRLMAQCAAYWSPILGRPVPSYRHDAGSELWAVMLSHRSAQQAASVLLAAFADSLPQKRRQLEIAAAYRSRPRKDEPR
ncbi:MAG: hypothetical protein JHD16_01000 [Solirubrobacteraceae bacterium]|nr:hypothetical protein [Solirubrobacteraceae bacterium]